MSEQNGGAQLRRWARRRGMPGDHDERFRRQEAIMEGLARMLPTGEHGREAERTLRHE